VNILVTSDRSTASSSLAGFVTRYPDSGDYHELLSKITEHGRVRLGMSNKFTSYEAISTHKDNIMASRGIVAITGDASVLSPQSCRTRSSE
jgi:hypothetical protein